MTDGRDVHYVKDEPNPAMLRVQAEEKACLDFFKLAQRFGAKVLPLGRHMGWVSVRAQP